MKNVYMELGSTFGLMAITQPLLCCHVLGMMIDAFGADHVLWGTDSVWGLTAMADRSFAKARNARLAHPAIWL